MSRLRNRMTRADFWTDPDLLAWPRDKRHFYQGLRSCAEDSGCDEDSPFGWMCILYSSPMDRDISLEQIVRWRDELIVAGKLIRYRTGGKDYLYQTTFHAHEHPRNPQAPSVPLPAWVKWMPNTSDQRKGHYEVRTADGWTPVKDLQDPGSVIVQESQEPCTAVEQGLFNDATTLPALPCPVRSRPVLNSPPPVDNSEPVDNSADPERVESENSTGQEPADPGATCDGSPCTVRDFDVMAVGPLRRVIQASDHPDLWKQYGIRSQFDAQLAVYAKRVCAAARIAFGELERPQRDELCKKALIAAVDSLKGSKDVQAVIAKRIRQAPDLCALCGDRVVEDLRRTKRDRRRKATPKPIADCMPTGFAQPTPRVADEGAA